jgi:hypothetical protein
MLLPSCLWLFFPFLKVCLNTTSWGTLYSPSHLN